MKMCKDFVQNKNSYKVNFDFLKKIVGKNVKEKNIQDVQAHKTVF